MILLDKVHNFALFFEEYDVGVVLEYLSCEVVDLYIALAGLGGGDFDIERFGLAGGSIKRMF